MKKDIKKMIKASESLGWSVSVNNKDFTFSKFSPAGQDFNIEITVENSEEIIDRIKEKCNNFDCSEETYIWLDNTGHGIKGAPYNMKDLYEDMEACLEMMEELYEKLKEIDI
jgi:hypothetical protein